MSMLLIKILLLPPAVFLMVMLKLLGRIECLYLLKNPLLIMYALRRPNTYWNSLNLSLH